MRLAEVVPSPAGNSAALHLGQPEHRGSDDATIRSQPSSSSKPPATAVAFAAPITGTVTCPVQQAVEGAGCVVVAEPRRRSARRRRRRSMPAQNARSPVPVSTTARTSGSDSASTIAAPIARDQRRRQRVAGLGSVQAERRGRASSPLADELARSSGRSPVVSARSAAPFMRSSTIGPKALSFSSSPGTLEALLEHDGELPLREDDVVVDVVDLPSRHLARSARAPRACDGMPYMST